MARGRKRERDMVLFCSSSSLSLVVGEGGVLGNGKNYNKLKQYAPNYLSFTWL
jgi:hypothetical protein